MSRWSPATVRSPWTAGGFVRTTLEDYPSASGDGKIDTRLDQDGFQRQKNTIDGCSRRHWEGCEKVV